MLIHLAIINTLLKLGYSGDISDNGVCCGISLRWLEASFSGEEEKFDERIKRIEQIDASGQDILQLVNAVKEKKGKNLTKQDDELLDLLAFFDSLKLYQDPMQHRDLFNARHTVNQYEVECISYFASSDAVRKLGGLVQVYSEPLLQTADQIKQYLISLQTLMAEMRSTDTLGVLLASYQHAIALTYQSHLGWCYMDINHYPPQHYQIDNMESLAQQIVGDLALNHNAIIPLIAFNAIVFTTNRYPFLLQLGKALEQFKKTHVLTEDVRAPTRDGIGLTFIAARHNHAELIVDLATHHVDLNQIDNDGFTPAYIAAQYGHAHVIAELAKYHADLNKKNNDGFTPACIAAQYGHAPVIAKLARYHADLNKAGNGGLTPACIAAQYGHAPVIAELAKYHADLNKAGNGGFTPACIAAQYGHAHVIAELAEHHADLNKANDRGLTPAYIAAKYGHAHVIAELAKYHADLNKAVDGCVTPAYIAAHNGHVNVIAELIKCGADLKVPYVLSLDALMDSFSRCREEEIMLRLQAYVAENATKGTTMISVTLRDIAFIMGHEQVVELLSDQPNLTMKYNNS